jgi:Mrp family chromosome partitioning ATPase
MSITLTEASKQVVIVDSDLRKPKQAMIFGVNSSSAPGLSRFLSSNIDAADVVKPTNVPNLHLITSGPLPSNPIEILTSEKMDTLVERLSLGCGGELIALGASAVAGQRKTQAVHP